MTTKYIPQASDADGYNDLHWRLLRGQIKEVGPRVDVQTGEAKPQFDVTKPLRIAGIANAAIVDRVNEMLDPRGAMLVNYLKNPVILLNHDYGQPIGSATLVEVKDDGVHFEAEIGRPDLAPLTDTQSNARSLIGQGTLQTVSVGFIPLEMSSPEYDDAGNLTKPAIYTKWELLEISVVSVPCNADSIFQMKELNMRTHSPRATGSLPMAPAHARSVPSPGAAPAGQQEPDGDEPVHGTAGEMLKAVLEHVGGLKSCAEKTLELHQELHKSMASLHDKVDKMGAEPTDAPGDAPVQTPSGTDGQAEPVKALTARIEKMEAGITKIAQAIAVIAKNVSEVSNGPVRL